MVWTYISHYSRLTLCQLPVLITCNWVPGFGVCIGYLTLPLFALSVYYRQTWEGLKRGCMPPKSHSPALSGHRSTLVPTQGGWSIGTTNSYASKHPHSQYEIPKENSVLSRSFSISLSVFSLCSHLSLCPKCFCPSIQPPIPLHQFFLGRLSVSTCGNMCSLHGPSSKQIADRTENMYSALKALRLNQWLACWKCFHSLRILERVKILILLHTAFLSHKQSTVLAFQVAKQFSFCLGVKKKNCKQN